MLIEDSKLNQKAETAEMMGVLVHSELRRNELRCKRSADADSQHRVQIRMAETKSYNMKNRGIIIRF